MTRLRRSDPNAPGISRRGRGRGFEYGDAAGRPATVQVEAAVLAMLRDS